MMILFQIKSIILLYLMMLKNFEKRMIQKKRKNNIPYKKITVKEFLSFLLSVIKYNTYQTHIINLDFNIDKINKS